MSFVVVFPHLPPSSSSSSSSSSDNDDDGVDGDDNDDDVVNARQDVQSTIMCHSSIKEAFESKSVIPVPNKPYGFCGR